MSKDLSKSARPAEPAATEGPSFDAESAGGPDGGADQGQSSGPGTADKADKADKAPPARTQAQLLEASLLLSHWVEVDAFPAAPSLLSVPVAPALATGGGGGAPPPDAPPDSPDAPGSPDDKGPNRGGAGAL
ncbi:MAG: hypothetical protein IT370_32160 [Deltaproteobacteria bacterium]|nr:hypothetical protein [Deltaproteobacteria bacterium]